VVEVQGVMAFACLPPLASSLTSVMNLQLCCWSDAGPTRTALLRLASHSLSCAFSSCGRPLVILSYSFPNSHADSTSAIQCGRCLTQGFFFAIAPISSHKNPYYGRIHPRTVPSTIFQAVVRLQLRGTRNRIGTVQRTAVCRIRYGAQPYQRGTLAVFFFLYVFLPAPTVPRYTQLQAYIRPGYGI
jgi:hypothetical protein